MAGVWYRLGTVALTQGSKRVTGAGTTWLDQATGPVVGNTFWGPDNKPYEVGLVISDTTLDLVETYAGPTVASAVYKINTTDKFSVAALAGQVAATLQYAQSQYANMSTWAAGDMPGDVPVILPNGIDTKLIPNLVSMVEATDGKLTETDQLKALDVPSSVFGRARLADANATDQLAALGASAFGRARLADANATDQLAALGASAFGQARLADANAAAQRTALALKKAALIDIIGTVTQPDAAGLTGAIVETGTNANGSYIKYAGGGAIALCSKEVASFPVTSAVGSVFQSSSGITIPLPINMTGGLRPSLEFLYYSGGARPWPLLASISVASVEFVLVSPVSMPSLSGVLYLSVVGKWY